MPLVARRFITVAMADPDDLLVMTAGGAVRGMERDGIASWRGIPFAEPPVGALRWLPPRPPRPWSGERDATRFGAVAVQPRDPQTALMSGVGDRVPMSEDCLVLNVFAPVRRDGKRPVMVWIHGGAFVMGSGSTPLYHGNPFVADDIVVVSINYRLGVLGFLYLGHRDEAYRAGNVALLDQVAALTWVRDNIAMFGGDPDNVTVMGESAGAVSIATLLGMAAARGLFHAAILESGASQLVVPSRADAIAVSDSILGELGAGDDLAALAALDVGRIVKVQTRTSAARGLGAFAPFTDGVTVPRPPIDAARDGSGIAVPLLIGWNRDEWSLFDIFLGEAAVEPVKPALRERFGEGIDELLAAYESERSGATRPWVTLIGDGVFRIPALRLAGAMSARVPVFVYRFDWASKAADGRLGAAHALELPFVWNRLDLPTSQFLLGGDAERARPLAARMHETWASFIRTHAPSASALPAWPAYDTVRRPTMLLDDNPRVVDDPDAVTRQLWEDLTRSS